MDLVNLDTSNVADMSYMFSMCGSLNDLNISDWNTSRVTNMSGIFQACRSIKTIDVSKWDTSSVTDMSNMFNLCRQLNGLDVSSWNTENVTNMANMFSACDNLDKIEVSNWTTDNVTNMSYMFKCKKIKNLNITNFNTTKVTNMERMFEGCESLEKLDLSSFDTSKVTIAKNMFYMCYNLEEITLGANFKWKVEEGYLPEPSPEYIPGADGKWYDTKDGKGYTPSELAEVERTEVRTYTAKPIYTVTFDANNGTIYDLGDTSTKRLVEYGNTYGSINMPSAVWDGYKFLGWYTAKTGGTKIDDLLNQNVTENITLYARWEIGAIAIYSEDDFSLRFYKPTTIPNSGDRYNGKIVSAVYTGIETNEYAEGANEPYDGSEDKDIPWYNVRKNITTVVVEDKISPVSTKCWFSKLSNLTSIDLKNLDTSNVTNMNFMFNGCKSLTSLDVSSLNTTNVEYMVSMFSSCKGITSLNLSNFKTAKVKRMI